MHYLIKFCWLFLLLHAFASSSWAESYEGDETLATCDYPVEPNGGFAWGGCGSAEGLAIALKPVGGLYFRDAKNNWQFIDRSADLRQLITELNTEISKHPDDSRVWLLRGLATRNLIPINRQTIWKKFSREEYFNSPELKQMVSEVNRDYTKALELATQQGAESQLTVKMAYIITQDTLPGVPDVETHEKIVRYEMAHTDTDQAPTPTYFQDAYTAIYENQIKNNRYDAALRTLDEMLEKFPNMQTDIEIARQKVVAAQNSVPNETLSSPSSQNTDTNTKEVNETVTEPVTEQPSLDVQTQIANQPRALWYALLLIGLIVVVTGALYLRRKK